MDHQHENIINIWIGFRKHDVLAIFEVHCNNNNWKLELSCLYNELVIR